MPVKKGTKIGRQRTIRQEWQVVSLSKSHSIAGIARETGLSKTVVLLVQRKYHITRSFGAGYHSRTFRCRYDPDKWKRLLTILYWDYGLDLHQVARVVGLSRSTVFARMEELHIPRRRRGEKAVLDGYHAARRSDLLARQASGSAGATILGAGSHDRLAHPEEAFPPKGGPTSVK